LDDPDDAIELLLLCYVIRPRSRRFAADVDDRGAIFLHVESSFDCDLSIEMNAAIGKRVRRHVDDSHHQRRSAKNESPLARKLKGLAAIRRRRRGRSHQTSRSRMMRAPIAFRRSSMRSY